MDELRRYSESELLNLIYRATKELNKRGVIRTQNLVGDYAEFLVSQKLNLKLQTSSKKAIDAIDDSGKTYQIKARRLTQGTSIPTIKSLRSFDFDYLVLVLFNEDYSVNACKLLQSSLAKELASPNPRVNGHRLNISPKLLSDPRLIEIVL